MSDDLSQQPLPDNPPGTLNGQPVPGPVVHSQLPPFEVNAINAAEAELRPRGWMKIRAAVTKPFHLLKHRVLGRSVDQAFEKLGAEEQEAIAVTTELGSEALGTGATLSGQSRTAQTDTADRPASGGDTLAK